VSTGETVQTFKGHGAAVSTVAYLPTGKAILTASWDRTARLWSVSSGQSRVLDGHGDRLSSAAASPDGTALATASWDGTVVIWEAETGREFLTLLSPGGRVQAIAFAPIYGR
jgi:WD40 repeat protein